jgi:predicted metal-dependent phosphoesterase TrpH
MTHRIDVELHSHTHYSRDSLNRLADMVHVCRAAGIDRIAVTDHSEIRGALRAHELAPDLVIVGEEVKTSEGDLLCLFIHELIPRGVTPEEAIARVHDQGGIIGAAHPLDPLRAGLGRENVLRLREQLDFLEVFNARTHDDAKNEGADALAQELGLPGVAGSDAHLLREIGTCRVRMREYTSPQDFLVALRGATLIKHYSSPMVHLGSRFAATAHRLGFDRHKVD